MQKIKDEVIESCDPTMVPLIKVEKPDDTPFIRDIVIKVEDLFKDVQHQDSSCSDVPSVRQPTRNKILFSCNVCDKQFFHKSELLSHTLYYHDEQHFCDICGLGFAKDDHLQQHQKSHGDLTLKTQLNHLRICELNAKTLSLKRPYSCPVCNKAFIYRHRLTKHMALHTGTHPYSCNICNKGFSYKGNLKQHLRTHTGEKSYSCDVCLRSFSRNHSLKVHVCGKPESKNKDCAFRSRKQPQLNGDEFCDADCPITRSKSKSTHQNSKLNDILTK